MLHAIIAVTIVLATWLGGAPVSQIFSAKFALWFIVLWLVSVVIIRLFRTVRFGFFAWATFVAVIFISYMTGGTFKYFFNDMPTLTVTENIPVEIKQVGRSGVIAFTNLSDKPLNRLEVECTLYYDNGTPVDYLFKSGTGGRTAYAKGFGGQFNVVDNMNFAKFRSSPDTMRCKATEAMFIEPVHFKTKLNFERNLRDFKTDFYVTNLDTVAIKNVQFQCVNNKGRSMKVNAFPAYLTDVREDTIIGAGETVKFVSDEANWIYTSCYISNAIAG